MEPYEIIRQSPLNISPWNYLTNVPPGLIIEFGVSNGGSLKVLCQNTNRKVYGFDSFWGLPEDWGSVNPKGAFSTNGIIPNNLPNNCECVVGLIQDTLPEFLKTHSDPVAFVHIDVDIYSTTSCILKHLSNRLQPGTILAFDELLDYADVPETDAGHWKYCEYKAFIELIEETNLKWECPSRCEKNQVVIKIIECNHPSPVA